MHNTIDLEVFSKSERLCIVHDFNIKGPIYRMISISGDDYFDIHISSVDFSSSEEAAIFLFSVELRRYDFEIIYRECTRSGLLSEFNDIEKILISLKSRHIDFSTDISNNDIEKISIYCKNGTTCLLERGRDEYGVPSLFLIK
ncbi:MAG: hypothetical protein R3E02_04205 [Blastomonas sp.]